MLRMKPCGKPGRSGPPANSNARTHGIHTLKRAVVTLGSRSIDRRTSVGRALAEWRRDLIADLGGPEQLSKQREALVDLCVREKLMLDTIDAFRETLRQDWRDTF